MTKQIRLFLIAILIALPTLAVDGHRKQGDPSCQCVEQDYSTQIRTLPPLPLVFLNQDTVESMVFTCGDKSENAVESRWRIPSFPNSEMALVQGFSPGPSVSLSLFLQATPWIAGDSDAFEEASGRYSTYLTVGATPVDAQYTEPSVVVVELVKNQPSEADERRRRDSLEISIPAGSRLALEYDPRYRSFMDFPVTAVRPGVWSVTARLRPGAAIPGDFFRQLTGKARHCYLEPIIGVTVRDATDSHRIARKVERLCVEVPCT
jgi:hypothetical protein